MHTAGVGEDPLPSEKWGNHIVLLAHLDDAHKGGTRQPQNGRHVGRQSPAAGIAAYANRTRDAKLEVRLDPR